MKVSREQASANRERILDTAAQLFRERGFDGVGVADLMKNAGLTHGGFYGHFASKEDLMAQACTRAHDAKLQRWQQLAESDPPRALARIVADYLRPEHRDAPGQGCLLAALAAEAPRHGPQVQGAVARALETQVEVLTAVVPGASKAARRSKALAIYSGLVGGLILARAVDDPKLSDDILKSVARQLLQLAG